MPDTYFTARVAEIIQESPTVRRFILKIDDTDDYIFNPGQFVMLDLPIEHEFTTRSYSIASAPGGNTLELCIVIKEDGAGTPYLFDNVAVGTRLRMSEPQGRFMLDENIDRDLCFICTGTGVAPFRSMLHHIFGKNIAHKNLYLIFGNRHSEDMLYHAEFEQMTQEHPEFTFIPVLSREVAPQWPGETGYVHHVYQRLFADRRPATFYLCGWSNMVKEAKNNLKEMGYSRKEIKFELYD